MRTATCDRNACLVYWFCSLTVLLHAITVACYSYLLQLLATGLSGFEVKMARDSDDLKTVYDNIMQAVSRLEAQSSSSRQSNSQSRVFSSTPGLEAQSSSRLPNSQSCVFSSTPGLEAQSSSRQSSSRSQLFSSTLDHPRVLKFPVYLILSQKECTRSKQRGRKKGLRCGHTLLYV